MTDPKLAELCINTLRFLSVDAVERAQSGHPGLPEGWRPCVVPQIHVIGLEWFGASAPGEVALRELGFSVEHVCEKASEIVKRGA